MGLEGLMNLRTTASKRSYEAKNNYENQGETRVPKAEWSIGFLIANKELQIPGAPGLNLALLYYSGLCYDRPHIFEKRKGSYFLLFRPHCINSEHKT